MSELSPSIPRREEKVLLVFGTRPEAIKMAPVIRELARHPETFDFKVCVTGQHREMLHQMLDFFEIEPDYDLDIMRPDQSLTDVTVEVLQGLGPILRDEQPDWVLVQGDTTTTMAAGLAAWYQHVRVGHVEAGLRTHDTSQPFPEEMNRRIAGLVADLHFAPTEWAADNLRREGVPEDAIFVTGNTVIDALQYTKGLQFDPSGIPVAEDAGQDRRLVLVTTHRRENLGRDLEEICAGIRRVARRADVHLICPVHPNPRVQRVLYGYLGDVANVTLVPPLDYQSTVWLLERCYFLITDSGGLQEEATGMGKPVLIVRETTDRPEGVMAGTAELIGADRHLLSRQAARLLDEPEVYTSRARTVSPYGDGHAAERIVDALASSRMAVRGSMSRPRTSTFPQFAALQRSATASGQS